MLRDIVRDYALETLADSGAVLVVDETGFLKQGRAFIDRVLYLPKAWMDDAARMARRSLAFRASMEDVV